MALKTRSGIYETSQEELRNLAKKNGLAQPPNSPLESSVIGANPDQAKMTSTPNQVRATTREQLEGPEDLQTVQRTSQPRKAANAEEKAKIQEAQSLEGLGSLDSRVQQLVEKKFSQTAENPPVTLQIDDSKIPQDIEPENREAFTTALQKVATGEATPEDILQINQALGRTEVGDALNAEEIKAQFLDNTQAIGNALAAQVPDNFTMGELDPAELGYSSWDDLAQSLQVSPEELQKMNLPAFTQAVQAKRRADFADADYYKQVLADPTAPRNEREEAKRILREMGATGERQAEEAVDSLSAQVEAGNTVEFAGREMSIQDLLKDETVSAIAKEYFENPEAANSIKEKYGDLANWFDENAEALKSAASEVDTQVEAFNDIQEANQEIGKWNDVGLQEDTLKTLFPEYGKLSASRLSAPPLLKQLSAADPQTRAATVSMLDGLASVNPDFARQLAGKSVEELAKYGAFDPEKRRQIEEFAREAAFVKAGNQEKDPWSFIGQVFDGASSAELEKQMKQLELGSRYGLPGSKEAKSILDALDKNRDGKLDTPKDIASRLALNTKGKSLTDILSGKSVSAKAGVTNTLDNILAQQAKMSPAESAIQQIISKDGALSGKGLIQAAQQLSAGDSAKDLQELYDHVKSDANGRNVIEQALKKKTREISDQAYGSAKSTIQNLGTKDIGDIQSAFAQLAEARKNAESRGVNSENDTWYEGLRSKLKDKLYIYVKTHFSKSGAFGYHLTEDGINQAVQDYLNKFE